MKTAPSTVSTTPTYYPQATSAKRSVAVVPVPTTAQHSLVQKPEKPPNTSSKKPDNTMPMWVPVALMVSSIGLVGFVAWLASRRNDPHLPPKLGTEAEPLAEAIAETVVEESSKPTPEQKSRWFRNKKKKPVKATTPKQTAIATLESNEENASLHPTQVAEPNTKNPKAKQQPSKVKTLSLYARWCTFAFACSYFISSFLPARLSLPVVPVLTGQTESLASKIPPITKNPIYKLGFNCIENVLQVTKSAVKNPSSFPPVIPQTLEKFSTATACSETLPVLTTWGNNRPSSFLLATYKGNQFVGIQIPKKLTKDELDKLTLKQLSDKFMPEFNTLEVTEKEWLVWGKIDVSL
ncbi:MAG: hypothetical protein NTW61_08975 [Candidatus Melainabacteria bacterium]|nr:hypothetical protein [Candidatus Melainabacteria bacterium]